MNRIGFKVVPTIIIDGSEVADHGSSSEDDRSLLLKIIDLLSVEDSGRIKALQKLLATEVIYNDLDDTLRQHGWNGERFFLLVDQQEVCVNLKRQLENKYLSLSTKKNRNLYSENSQIISYCPDLLTRVIQFYKSSTLKPSHVFFKGTCVLADISGFTKLSGKKK